MKLIAGSILTGFSLLALVFGHVNVEAGARIFRRSPDFVIYLATPVEVIAILIMALGITLIFWELWQTKGRLIKQ